MCLFLVKQIIYIPVFVQLYCMTYANQFLSSYFLLRSHWVNAIGCVSEVSTHGLLCETAMCRASTRNWEASCLAAVWVSLSLIWPSLVWDACAPISCLSVTSPMRPSTALWAATCPMSPAGSLVRSWWRKQGVWCVHRNNLFTKGYNCTKAWVTRLMCNLWHLLLIFSLSGSLFFPAMLPSQCTPCSIWQ